MMYVDEVWIQHTCSDIYMKKKQNELCQYNLYIMCKFNTIYVILTQKFRVILAQFVGVLV